MKKIELILSDKAYTIIKQEIDAKKLSGSCFGDLDYIIKAILLAIDKKDKEVLITAKEK